MASGELIGSLVVEARLRTDKYWKSSRRVINANQKMAKALKRLDKAQKNTTKNTKALSKSFSMLGNILLRARFMQVSGLFGGLLSGTTIVKGVKELAKFDSAMTQSLAIVKGVSGGMRKEMEELATRMSQNFSFGAEELAKAYFYLESAGLSVAQSMVGLPVVTEFAQAGMFNLAQATDLLTDSYSALGPIAQRTGDLMADMTHLGDTLVAVNTMANASVQQFAEALGNKAAQSFKTANIPLNQGVALLAAFADQSVKGRTAGERTAIMLTNLQSAAHKNAEAWREQGLAIYDAGENLRHIADIFKNLEGIILPLTPKARVAMLQTLGFADRARKAILALVGTSGKLRDFSDKLMVVDGVMRRVSKAQLKSLTNQFKILKNVVSNTARIFTGDWEDSIRSVITMVGELFRTFQRLSPVARKAITVLVVSLGALSAAAVPAMIGIGALALTISSIATHIISVKLAMASIGVAFSTVASILGVLASAIAVIAASFVLVVFATVKGQTATEKWANTVKALSKALQIAKDQWDRLTGGSLFTTLVTGLQIFEVNFKYTFKQAGNVLVNFMTQWSAIAGELGGLVWGVPMTQWSVEEFKDSFERAIATWDPFKNSFTISGEKAKEIEDILSAGVNTDTVGEEHPVVAMIEKMENLMRGVAYHSEEVKKHIIAVKRELNAPVSFRSAEGFLLASRERVENELLKKKGIVRGDGVKRRREWGKLNAARSDTAEEIFNRQNQEDKKAEIKVLADKINGALEIDRYTRKDGRPDTEGMVKDGLPAKVRKATTEAIMQIFNQNKLQNFVKDQRAFDAAQVIEAKRRSKLMDPDSKDDWWEEDDGFWGGPKEKRKHKTPLELFNQDSKRERNTEIITDILKKSTRELVSRALITGLQNAITTALKDAFSDATTEL